MAVALRRSARSQVQRRPRLSLRVAQAIRVDSAEIGYFGPKPPPTSSVTSRSFSFGRFEHPLAHQAMRDLHALRGEGDGDESSAASQADHAARVSM